MANASKHGMGVKGGVEHVGPTPADEAFDIDDLADEIHGRNKLQGNDQSNVHNERIRQAGETRRTEGVVESFEKSERHEASKNAS